MSIANIVVIRRPSVMCMVFFYIAKQLLHQQDLYNLKFIHIIVFQFLFFLFGVDRLLMTSHLLPPRTTWHSRRTYHSSPHLLPLASLTSFPLLNTLPSPCTPHTIILPHLSPHSLGGRYPICGILKATPVYAKDLWSSTTTLQPTLCTKRFRLIHEACPLWPDHWRYLYVYLLR